MLAEEIDRALAARAPVINPGGDLDYWHWLYKQGKRNVRDLPFPGAADLSTWIIAEKIDAMRARFVKTMFVEPVWVVDGWGKAAQRAAMVEEFHQWKLEEERLQGWLQRTLQLALIEGTGVLECSERADMIKRRGEKTAARRASDQPGRSRWTRPAGPTPARTRTGNCMRRRPLAEGVISPRSIVGARAPGPELPEHQLRDFLCCPPTPRMTPRSGATQAVLAAAEGAAGVAGRRGSTTRTPSRSSPRRPTGRAPNCHRPSSKPGSTWRRRPRRRPSRKNYGSCTACSTSTTTGARSGTSSRCRASTGRSCACSSMTWACRVTCCSAPQPNPLNVYGESHVDKLASIGEEHMGRATRSPTAATSSTTRPSSGSATAAGTWTRSPGASARSSPCRTCGREPVTLPDVPARWRARAGHHRRGGTPERPQRRDARQRAPGESDARRGADGHRAELRPHRRADPQHPGDDGRPVQNPTRTVEARRGRRAAGTQRAVHAAVAVPVDRSGRERHHGQTLAGTFHGKPHGSVESADKRSSEQLQRVHASDGRDLPK